MRTGWSVIGKQAAAAVRRLLHRAGLCADSPAVLPEAGLTPEEEEARVLGRRDAAAAQHPRGSVLYADERRRVLYAGAYAARAWAPWLPGPGGRLVDGAETPREPGGGRTPERGDGTGHTGTAGPRRGRGPADPAPGTRKREDG